MCGRYTLTSPGAALAELVDDPRAAELAAVAMRPRFNIAPTQNAPVVRRPARAREVAELRWGLVPAFARDLAVGSRQINARAETVADKPAFRDSLATRRCLVPADGFYEWRRDPADARRKVPFFIHRPGRRPFAFAGLWARWASRGRGADATPVETFTILTTEPTEFMSTLHDRMPLILEPAEQELWLEADADTARAWLASLPPRTGTELVAYAVSPRVNRPAEDDPELLVPAGDAPGAPPPPQLSLF
jgi:putative SOS response-associated peptidase YedK